MSKRCIGLFGGTFDPIHNGHLHIARQILEVLALDEIRFIPCKVPALKPISIASEAQRLEMLSIALAHEPKYIIDDREFKRENESYTYVTLQSLRKDYPYDSLVWIMGFDAFQQLPKWHCWRELIKLCHFAVVNRPGNGDIINEPLLSFLKKYKTSNINSLCNSTSGYVLFIDIDPCEISASVIRKDIKSIPADWLTPEVAQYIQLNKLY
jgi:nicotinate-nucleotide adenylyltransferase